MEALRMMVKSVLIIVMVAAFLEIMMPRSDMKRYINLIIGLFIIVAVLNPFLAIIHKGFSFEVLENLPSGTTGDTADLVRNGREMAVTQRKKVVGQYKEKLSKQVMALSGLYQDIMVTGVDVDIIEDSADPRFGQVNRITIQTGNRSGRQDNRDRNSKTAAGEVQIDEISVDTGLHETENAGNAVKNDSGVQKIQDISRLRDVIANFYGLLPEQVVIRN